MADTGVHTGLHHGGLVAFELLFKLRRESTGFVVHVPVKAFREHQALRLLQTERMHIGEEHQERSHLLPLCAVYSEFPRGLDCIDGILRAVRKADHLRLGRLSLHDER